MSGPYTGNEDAAEDMARRLAETSLPSEAAGVLHRHSMARATGTLASPGARAMPPPGWRIEADDMGGAMLLEEPEGGPLRLWAAMDAAGWLHVLLDWKHWKTGGLGHAWLRLPGGDGLEIHPGAGSHPLWGQSDELLHITGRHITGGHITGTPNAPRSRTLGLLPALPYHRLETLPPFNLPSGLPPGAGGAVLNLLARLMVLQGRRTAHYRGPYPTAALFDSLSRCFRPSPPETGRHPSPEKEHPEEEHPSEDQLGERFSREEMELAFRGEMVANPIAWEPAPFAQLLSAPDVLVHLRDGVETVWVGRKAFRFRPWRDGLLSAGASIWRETGEGEPVEGAATYGVGLTMLGQPWLRFLLLGQDGGIRETSIPRQRTGDPGPGNFHSPPPLTDLWRPAIFCWCAVAAVPALAPAILALETTLAIQWAPLKLCLAEASPEGGLLLNAGMAGRFLTLQSAREKNDSGDAAESGALAMMMISDVLGELAPLVRGAAQRKLALDPQHDPGRLIGQGARLQAEARTRLDRSLPELAAALQRGEALPLVPR